MINWNRVDELRDEIGQEDFLEIVEIFLEEVDEVIAKLEASVDPSKLEDYLHFLKGSALNLGFLALSEICHLGEKNAAAQAHDKIDVAAVVATYVRSKAEFNGGAGIDRIAI